MGHDQPAQILTWMQQPMGYRTRHDSQIDLASFQALIFNPWTLWQYLRSMIGSVLTASFVMSSIGAFLSVEPAARVVRQDFR